MLLKERDHRWCEKSLKLFYMILPLSYVSNFIYYSDVSIHKQLGCTINLILKAQPYGLTSHLTIYIIIKFSYVKHTHSPIIYTKRPSLYPYSTTLQI